MTIFLRKKRVHKFFKECQIYDFQKFLKIQLVLKQEIDYQIIDSIKLVFWCNKWKSKQRNL